MHKTVEYQGVPAPLPDVNRLLCYRQIVVDEDYCMPPGKPAIKQLVGLEAVASIGEWKIVESPAGRKVFIKGQIEQQILYATDAPCQPVHVIDFLKPFYTFLQFPCNCQAANYDPEWCEPRVIVEFAQADLINPCNISKAVILFLWIPKFPRICHPTVRIVTPNYRRCCN